MQGELTGQPQDLSEGAGRDTVGGAAPTVSQRRFRGVVWICCRFVRVGMVRWGQAW